MYPQQPQQPQQPSQPYYPPQQPSMPYMQPQPPQRPGNWFTRLGRPAQVGIGCLTLIVICGFCGAIGSLVSNANGSNTANTSTSTSTNATQAPQATNTPAPPTNTPKPKAWVTVHHYTGSATQQTETFHVGGQWRMKWSCQKADDFGGNFAVTMYYSDGSYGDLVANTSDNNSGVYNGHGDGDIYLKMDTYSENWTVDIQQFQ